MSGLGQCMEGTGKTGTLFAVFHLKKMKYGIPRPILNYCDL